MRLFFKIRCITACMLTFMLCRGQHACSNSLIPTQSEKADVIIKLKILSNFPSAYSDLSKTSIVMTCKAIESSDSEIPVGDTILFWHEFLVGSLSKQAEQAEKIRKNKNYSPGRQFTVWLKKRNPDDIVYTDSAYTHLLRGQYNISEFMGKPMIIQKRKEYKLIKITGT